MTTRPSLLRSIPFWVLIAGSLATSAVGAWLLTSTTGSMTTGLTDGTATTADVYVGQVVAIAGAILIATGLVGLALALVLGAVRSLIPAQVVEAVEPMEWAMDDIEDDEAPAQVVAGEPVAEAGVTR